MRSDPEYVVSPEPMSKLKMFGGCSSLVLVMAGLLAVLFVLMQHSEGDVPVSDWPRFWIWFGGITAATLVFPVLFALAPSESITADRLGIHIEATTSDGAKLEWVAWQEISAVALVGITTGRAPVPYLDRSTGTLIARAIRLDEERLRTAMEAYEASLRQPGPPQDWPAEPEAAEPDMAPAFESVSADPKLVWRSASRVLVALTTLGLGFSLLHIETRSPYTCAALGVAIAAHTLFLLVYRAVTMCARYGLTEEDQADAELVVPAKGYPGWHEVSWVAAWRHCGRGIGSPLGWAPEERRPLLAEPDSQGRSDALRKVHQARRSMRPSGELDAAAERVRPKLERGRRGTQDIGAYALLQPAFSAAGLAIGSITPNCIPGEVAIICSGIGVFALLTIHALIAGYLCQKWGAHGGPSLGRQSVVGGRLARDLTHQPQQTSHSRRGL